MTEDDVLKYIKQNVLLVSNQTDINWIKEQLWQREDEFCYSLRFSRSLLNRYCYHGFLPMSVNFLGKDFLALKLHVSRVLLPPSSLLIKNKIMNKFTNFTISMNTNFEKCIHAINEYHPDSWLSTKLIKLFVKSHYEPGRVKLHSVELWNQDLLVAGEIGYTVGSCYTSLTGFHTLSSSGTAQLFALGKLLDQNGIRLWDMGMYAPYKLELGGKLYPREEFLTMFSSVRDDQVELRSQKIFLKDLK